MADYSRDFLSFEAVLDRAFLTTSFPGFHDRVTLDPNAPSAVRVLGKSMHVLAWGWTLAVGWLWMETIQQHLLRHGIAPAFYAMDMMFRGLIPAVLMAFAGAAIARWAGRAPNRFLQRREWHHAFWWSLVPNALLFLTVWVMLQEAQ